jgi:hypothetical protein
MRAIPLAIFSLTLLLGCSSAQSDKKDPGPKEHGRVRWLRDLDASKLKARADGKTLFLQFQEVPG